MATSSWRATRDLTWSLTADTPYRRLIRAIRGLQAGQLLTVSGKGDLKQLQNQLYPAIGKMRGRMLRTHRNATTLEVWITDRKDAKDAK